MRGGSVRPPLAGGTASGAILQSGGALIVASGGNAIATTVASGGINSVTSGGVWSGAILNAGGQEIVISGGSARVTTINSGGTETVSSGGVASGDILKAGGTLTVAAGGSECFEVVRIRLDEHDLFAIEDRAWQVAHVMDQKVRFQLLDRHIGVAKADANHGNPGAARHADIGSGVADHDGR